MHQPQPNIGEVVRIRAQITTQNAECPATGVRAVAEFYGGATILNAQSEQGNVLIDRNKVYFSIGRIGVHKSVVVDVSLRFNLLGSITNRVTAYASGLTSKSVLEFPHDLVVLVSGQIVPSLTADRDPNGHVRMRIGGHVGTTYVIEKSLIVVGNGRIEWSAVKEIELSGTETIYTHVITSEASAMLFRVRKK